MTCLKVTLMALCFSLLTDVVQSAPVPARPADALVDSIGVNTHFGYTDRPYVTDFDQVKAKLGASGIRHIRDGADARKDVAARINELHDRYGIRVLQIVGPRVDSPTPWRGTLAPEKIGGVLNTIKTLYPRSNEAIEGPNEYDVTHGNALPSAADPDWTATLRRYTEALWKAVKADPVLEDRPVLAPSMAHAANAPKVGDLSAFITYGNMHPYPGGWNPSHNLEGYNVVNTIKVSSDKPIWATETGYHNAMKQKPGGHNAAPEAAAGKYGPRLVAEYFRRGIGRAYFYEFLDEGTNPAEQEHNFGLVRHDLSEKPIYTALKATIDLLKDPGKPFNPRPLDYALEGDLTDVRQVLLQKRNGRHYLLLWQEVPSYDVNTRTVLNPPTRPLTLRLNERMRRARLYLPTTHGTKALETHSRPRTLKLDVPDHLLIVELRP
ncbi:MAG: hypothetical protein KY468_07775 [Armatimonadetes bacterium]|nr:hypothetical protein [Armatimonadota bacterium]